MAATTSFESPLPAIPATSRLRSTTPAAPVVAPTIYVALELTGFQCVLRGRDGPVVVLGVETAELKGDHVCRRSRI